MLGILNPITEYLLALGVHKPVILLDLSKFHYVKFMEGQMSRSPNLYDLANVAAPWPNPSPII